MQAAVRSIRNYERERSLYPEAVRRLADAFDLRDGAIDESMTSAGRRLGHGNGTAAASGLASHSNDEA